MTQTNPKKGLIEKKSRHIGSPHINEKKKNKRNFEDLNKCLSRLFYLIKKNKFILFLKVHYKYPTH